MADLTNILGGMGERELERLEKLARRLIDSKLSLEKVEGNRGMIYLANGIDLDGKIIGLWGYRGVAHDVMFEDDSTLDGIRQYLINEAHSVVEEMIDRDKLHA